MASKKAIGYIGQKEFDEFGTVSVKSKYGSLLNMPIVSKDGWKGNPIEGEKKYMITIEEIKNGG